MQKLLLCCAAELLSSFRVRGAGGASGGMVCYQKLQVSTKVTKGHPYTRFVKRCKAMLEHHEGKSVEKQAFLHDSVQAAYAVWNLYLDVVFSISLLNHDVRAPDEQHNPMLDSRVRVPECCISLLIGSCRFCDFGVIFLRNPKGPGMLGFENIASACQ